MISASSSDSDGKLTQWADEAIKAWTEWLRQHSSHRFTDPTGDASDTWLRIWIEIGAALDFARNGKGKQAWQEFDKATALTHELIAQLQGSKPGLTFERSGWPRRLAWLHDQLVAKVGPRP